MKISFCLSILLRTYMFLMVLWCFLTWFPRVDWNKQPQKMLNTIVYPYLKLFEKIIPQVGNINFSPIIAFALLYFISNIIINFLAKIGF